jgi:N-acetylmuramoyl-L-alanine amidase
VLADSRTTIYDFRYYTAPEHTRLVLDIQKGYKYQLQKTTNKLTLKLKNTKLLNRTFKHLFFSDKRINKITLNRKNDWLYIYFHLKKNYKIKTLNLKPNTKYPHHRLVIDFKEKVIEKITPKNDKKIIILDAGHGGEDPGAVSKNKTFEKTIVLSIAKKLQKLINVNPQFNAILSRKSDYYVKLSNRPKFAQKNKADLFISIHADSALRRSASGASVYVLSKKGGTTKLAKQLEKTENSTDIFDDYNDIIKDDEILSKNMWQLAQQNSKTESDKFAKLVLKHFAKITKLHKKTPQKANFVVLKTPAIASILVESAFLSNPQDERKLLTNSYQNKVAKALYNAIVEYFK